MTRPEFETIRAALKQTSHGPYCEAGNATWVKARPCSCGIGPAISALDSLGAYIEGLEAGLDRISKTRCGGYVMSAGSYVNDCGARAIAERSLSQIKDDDDYDDYMCPNCVTPWKCNGPHLPNPERNE